MNPNKPKTPSACTDSHPPGDPVSPAGIGLRHVHYRAVVETRPAIGWLEVHPENFFGGGAHRHFLEKARALYPVSFHAVGLSLGSAEPVSREHLRKIAALAAEFKPFRISDHASWSLSGNAHLNDLLPLPYTAETLDILCRNVAAAQDMLGRTILIENPSTYLAFKDSTMTEWDFLNETVRRTGCGLLLDVNNVYVQARNHGFEARDWLHGIDAAAVGEIHLAGHTEKKTHSGDTVLIDTHNAPVRPEVWDLYAFALERTGPAPVLIEWDQDFPPLETLVAEAQRAAALIPAKEGPRHAAA